VPSHSPTPSNARMTNSSIELDIIEGDADVEDEAEERVILKRKIMFFFSLLKSGRYLWDENSLIFILIESGSLQ
jgi:hypothetical protein